MRQEDRGNKSNGASSLPFDQSRSGGHVHVIAVIEVGGPVLEPVVIDFGEGCSYKRAQIAACTVHLVLYHKAGQYTLLF